MALVLKRALIADFSRLSGFLLHVNSPRIIFERGLKDSFLVESCIKMYIIYWAQIRHKYQLASSY